MEFQGSFDPNLKELYSLKYSNLIFFTQFTYISQLWPSGQYDRFLMGQPVTVIQKSSSKPGVQRYEINRSITGMDHERYKASDEILGERPPDTLAKAIFQLGGVDKITMNSNVIIVDSGKGGVDPNQVMAIIMDMFTYYLPGVEVPSFENNGD